MFLWIAVGGVAGGGVAGGFIIGAAIVLRPERRGPSVFDIQRRLDAEDQES